MAQPPHASRKSGAAGFSARPAHPAIARWQWFGTVQVWIRGVIETGCLRLRPAWTRERIRSRHSTRALKS